MLETGLVERLSRSGGTLRFLPPSHICSTPRMLSHLLPFGMSAPCPPFRILEISSDQSNQRVSGHQTQLRAGQVTSILSEVGHELTSSDDIVKYSVVLEGKAFLNLQFGIHSLAPLETSKLVALLTSVSVC